MIFSRDISGTSNRVFLLFILAVAVWISGLIIVFESESSITGLEGLRLAFAGAALIAPAFTHFAVVFPQRAQSIPKIFLPFLYIVGITFSFAAIFTEDLVENILLLTLGYRASYGWLHPLFGVYFIGSMSVALWIIFYKYKAVIAEKKPQMRFFLLGAAATVILTTTTNFIIPTLTGVSLYSRYGPFGMIPFVFLTSYAIIRHNFLNIRLIAAELFTFSIVFTLFIRFLLSQNTQDLVFNGAILVAMVIFGDLLIRSVLKEVKSREKITELASELQKSNAELKKLDAAKSEFVSIASHQLRAPLTVIKGYISMFLDGTFGQVTQGGKEALGKVAFSAEQLVKLVGDLLNLSRIESGKLRYTLTRTNILSLIQQVAEEFKISFEEKGLKLEIMNSLSKPIYLYVDPDKLREVMINLISNALKYASRKVEIEVEDMGMGTHDSTVRLIVKDDGIGIKAEDLPGIFTKFHRTPEAQKIDPNGMGIGLYFVKRIVEDHGGKVRVDSQGLGKGTSFVVDLPLNE